ncbi:hypothetical protein L3Y34_009923 [Caenorhabditis briggsae]|uniref:Nuclear Hormone Receptor family n=3 Tax=Caenorhabditis briggsae TaxID=6238 RepID=A0AAE9A767_CAEBR|nr:hypothetical protein L3Y34_009923 [Caenorhabditis briggsae]
MLALARNQSPKICKISSSTVKCEICKIQKSHGNHFGVNSCRACAAFFRRTVHSKWSQLKCQGGSCNKITFFCKPCRLQRCFEGGMVTANFQYNRDGISPPSDTLATITTLNTIPPSLDQYLGKPHFLFLSEKNPKKTIIDLHRLLGEASKILNLGPAAPIFCGGNQLKKLSFGLKNDFNLAKLKMAKRMTKSEIAGNWEHYVKKVATWLTHFDEYKKLSIGLQMKILQTIWHIWSRLEKLSTTAKYRRVSGKIKKTEVVVQNGVLIDIGDVDFDSSWLSDYPNEIVRGFLMHSSCDQFTVTDGLYALQLTDIELTYMLAQLCFQYAGNRYQGKIQEVCDRFLTVLSNDLHDYYVNEMDNPRYAQRLAKMMQLNNAIQQNIRCGRDRMHLVHTFGLLKLEFTHPEMFRDSGFH